MLTENYRKWVNGVLRFEGAGGSYALNGLKSIDGRVLGTIQLNTNPAMKLDFYYGNYPATDIHKKECSSIFIGTGQKEESQEDFALENIVPDSDLTNVSANVTFTEGKFVFSKTFTYTGTDDITITEVAYYKSMEGTDSKIRTYCLARQLIEPLAVKTGDTFTVTMVIG